MQLQTVIQHLTFLSAFESLICAFHTILLGKEFLKSSCQLLLFSQLPVLKIYMCLVRIDYKTVGYPIKKTQSLFIEHVQFVHLCSAYSLLTT